VTRTPPSMSKGQSSRSQGAGHIVAASGTACIKLGLYISRIQREVRAGHHAVLPTGHIVLVREADCSETVRSHRLDDLRYHVFLISRRETLWLIATRQYPRAPEQRHSNICLAPFTTSASECVFALICLSVNNQDVNIDFP